MSELILYTPIGKSWLGIIIPAIIFCLSFIATWLLYKHFSRQA